MNTGLAWRVDVNSETVRNFGVVAALLCFSAACSSPPEPPDASIASVRFAVIGDAPYQGLDFPRYRRALEELNKLDLDFVIHVGDILWYPCDEATYEDRLAGFQSLQQALIYTPGDNEWADCHEKNAGAYAPLERLRKLREVFFANPEQSLGALPIWLTPQSLASGYGDYVENARWAAEDIVFATFHMPGSWNAGSMFPSRSKADDQATAERTSAAVAWISEAFVVAAASDAKALVLATHADMTPAAPPEDPYRLTYAPVLEQIQQQAAVAGIPVLLVHGDSHDLIVDQPFDDPATGHTLPHVTRLQVMGAPDVGWVEITIHPDEPQPFRFEPHYVPWWVVF